MKTLPHTPTATPTPARWPATPPAVSSVRVPQTRVYDLGGEGGGVSWAWKPRPQTEPHSAREAVLSEAGGWAEQGAAPPPSLVSVHFPFLLAYKMIN